MENNENIAMESMALYKRSPSLQVILGKGISDRIGFEDIGELINLTRDGISVSVLKPLAKHLGLTMEEISGLLQSSYRNIQRKSNDDKLDSFKSEKVLELASLVNKGIEILGTKDAFKVWLHSDLIVLRHSKPVDLLDTSFGVKVLEDILGRIAYGVYS